MAPLGRGFGTAIASPSTLAPTGTVAVSDGNATCSFTLPATSCNLIGAAVGNVSLTASYSGDSINVPAMASATHIVVDYGDTLSIGSVTGPDRLYGATTFTVTLAAI
jgi:hypothetical protein